MTKIAKGWPLKKFADHYVAVINTPADENGNHRSPIFADSKNILLIASIRFGKAKAHRVFAQAVGKAVDKLKP